ncbi:MAG: hypothetical protein ACI4XJ_02335 [Eubacteriales bacterium]
MEKGEEKKGFAGYFGSHKKEIFSILLLILGLALILLGSLDFGKGKNTEVKYDDVSFYTEYLEDKIEEICRSIGGIDEVQVLLTLDCSSEYVYGESASDYIILKNDSGEDAVLLREIYPKVRGIAVVCTGGDLPRIRETITELLSAAMGISVSKIKVAGM